MTRRNIDLSDQVWQIAATSGDATAYIEQAVKARYRSELRAAGNAVTTAMPQAAIDEWTLLGMSSADDGRERRK